ncbi:ANTAR domain-containing protein [Streptomyces sp. NPDC087263]|uniref:ANTAR domain-containing protein n=1 Tax=Streptomyces sp. NPDC087263 TaxID=3365773 RepID=UPI003816D6AB
MTSETTSGNDERRGVPTESPVPAEVVEEIFELREEVGQLKEAVTSHATVDQAIGMMVALGRVTPDEGWAVLREVSQRTNVKLRSIAELVLVWGRTGDLPSDIRAPLEEALDRYGPTQIPGAPPQP